MRPVTNTSEVYGTFQPSADSKFSGELTPKLMEILSNGLYKYKTPAIVRELMCNAYDSHVEAGIADTPFRVNIPNVVNPVFEVEDFGVGLDYEGVRKVYTVYGRSTKDQRNDLIGAYGLGSKTPFAYTKAYTITARKNNVERIFSAYMDGDGNPRADLISEQIGQFPNGVKVSVPVEKSDISDFRIDVSFVGSMFEVKPTVTGIDGEFKYAYGDDLLTNLKKDGHAVVDRAGYTGKSIYDHHTFVVVGNVAYPVEGIGQYCDDNFVRHIASGHRIFIDVPLGEVNISPSRESLSMDKSTSAYVKNLMEETGAKIKDSFVQQVCSLPLNEFMRKGFSDHYLFAEVSHPEFEKIYGRKDVLFGDVWRKPIEIKAELWDAKMWAVTKLINDSANGAKHKTKKNYVSLLPRIFLRGRNRITKVNVLYHDTDEKIKFSNLVGDYYARQTPDTEIVIMIQKRMTESRKRVIEKQFTGMVDVEFVDMMPIYQKVKESRGNRKKVSNQKTYDIGQKEDNTIWAKSFQGNGENKIQHLVIENPDEWMYCVDESGDSMMYSMSVKWDDSYGIHQRHYLSAYEMFNICDKKRKVILATTKNIEKIKQFGIPSVQEVMFEKMDIIKKTIIYKELCDVVDRRLWMTSGCLNNIVKKLMKSYGLEYDYNEFLKIRNNENNEYVHIINFTRNFVLLDTGKLRNGISEIRDRIDTFQKGKHSILSHVNTHEWQSHEPYKEYLINNTPKNWKKW